MSVPQYVPEGDLTVFEAAQLKDRLIGLMACDGPALLELSSVRRVDASAIQLLIAATKSSRLTLTGLTSDLLERCRGLGWEPVIEQDRR